MHGKKYTAARGKVNEGALLPAKTALENVKQLAFVKFDESIDLNVNLGIDAAKGEQAVRGSLVLPHQIAKQIRVIVFAKGDYAEKALSAGADVVGAEDLVEKIEGGWLDFDVAVATPDLMGLVSKLAKILGPKGLLPNKKLGTVAFEVDAVVADLKKGRTFFKNDKSGLVHFKVGKVSFAVDKLLDNVSAFVKALAQAKPSTAKGKFIKKITVSSTMGPGIQIDADQLLV